MIIKELFFSLNETSMGYIVLRYSEKKINDPKYDIDIFTKSNSERQKIAFTILNFFKKKHARLILNNKNPFCHKLIFVTQEKGLKTGENIFVFELRFFYSIKNKIIFDQKVFEFIDKTKTIPVLRRGAEGTLIILRNIFSQRTFNKKYQKTIFYNTEEIESQLTSYISDAGLIQKIITLIRNKKLDNLLLLRDEAYAALKNTNGNFWNLFVFKIQHGLISLYNYLTQNSKIFVILGPDGSGKTTIINLVRELFDLHKIPVMTVKFNERKKKVTLKEKSNFQKIPKQTVFKSLSKRSPFINSLREIMLILQGVLFYLIFVKYHASKGTIILYDRYYSDIFMKAKKSGLHISSLALSFSKLVPSPIMSFMLYGPPNVILKRKKELTKKQIMEYYDFTEKYVKKYFKLNSTKIDIENTPRYISEKIMLSITEKIQNEY